MATSAEDIEAAVNLILAEAAGEGQIGMDAVAHVLTRRMETRGLDLYGVISEPSQFAGFSNPGSGVNYRDPELRAMAEKALLGAITGTTPDPTGGADHFYSGNRAPSWASKLTPTAEIGGHKFFTSEERTEAQQNRDNGFTINGFAESRGIENVDARLVDIMRRAAAESPYNVELFSGKRYNNSGRHGAGAGVDIVLVDPDTGEQIPNYAAGGEAYKIYEDYARTAREIQEDLYPELSRDLRWGGYFGSSGKNPEGFDLMHFDLTPGAPMSRGSWESGLKPEYVSTVANLGDGKTYSRTGIVNGTQPSRTLLASGEAKSNITPPTPKARIDRGERQPDNQWNQNILAYNSAPQTPQQEAAQVFDQALSQDAPAPTRKAPPVNMSMNFDGYEVPTQVAMLPDMREIANGGVNRVDERRKAIQQETSKATGVASTSDRILGALNVPDVTSPAPNLLETESVKDDSDSMNIGGLNLGALLGSIGSVAAPLLPSLDEAKTMATDALTTSTSAIKSAQELASTPGARILTDLLAAGDRWSEMTSSADAIMNADLSQWKGPQSDVAKSIDDSLRNIFSADVGDTNSYFASVTGRSEEQINKYRENKRARGGYDN